MCFLNVNTAHDCCLTAHVHTTLSCNERILYCPLNLQNSPPTTALLITSMLCPRCDISPMLFILRDYLVRMHCVNVVDHRIADIWIILRLALLEYRAWPLAVTSKPYHNPWNMHVIMPKVFESYTANMYSNHTVQQRKDARAASWID